MCVSVCVNIGLRSEQNEEEAKCSGANVWRTYAEIPSSAVVSMQCLVFSPKHYQCQGAVVSC